MLTLNYKHIRKFITKKLKKKLEWKIKRFYL